jgi:hypothetical protein
MEDFRSQSYPERPRERVDLVGVSDSESYDTCFFILLFWKIMSCRHASVTSLLDFENLLG